MSPDSIPKRPLPSSLTVVSSFSLFSSLPSAPPRSLARQTLTAAATDVSAANHVDAASSTYSGFAFSTSSCNKYADYAYHVKDVTEVDFDKLLQLDCQDPKTRENLQTSLPWLLDASRYDDLPIRNADGIPQARMDLDFVDLLEKHKVIRRIERRQVRGHVKMFAVPEVIKKRLRPIKHTEWANFFFGKETLREISLDGKKQIVQFVLAGDFAACFDFAAWYDQLKYAAGIGERFCFKKGKQFYCLDKLAMGQRQAVEVAHSITEFLVDFPERRCKAVGKVIDNIIFVGSFEDVQHDIQIFYDRVKFINAQLNEEETIQQEGLDSMIVSSTEWCGVFLNCKNNTVALTEKSLDKTWTSWWNRNCWSWRNFAAHVGLLFWSWGILDVPVHKYYELLRFISTKGRFLQEHDDQWDQPAVIPDSVMKVLAEWTLLVLQNSPRVVKPSTETKWFVVTDASSWGWGYVAMNAETGEIRTHGEKWTREQEQDIYKRGGFYRMKKSVYSEPLAVYFSLCHLLKSGESIKLEFAKEIRENVRYKIQVATDNSSAQHTLNRGFASRSRDINSSIEMVRDAFPQSCFDINFDFVPGKKNCSDPYSRGVHDKGTNSTNKGIVKQRDDRLRREVGEIFRIGCR